MSLIPSLGLSTVKVSGAVAAAIIAASIALAAMGVLTYVRKTEPFKTWLVPYTPAAQYGGIFLYSNVIWGVLWVGLFLGLRHKQNAGNLKTWLIFFLVSLGIGTGFAEASLNWSQLPTMMQFSSSSATESSSETTSEVSVTILKGSSIQGSPAYAPSIVTASKDSTITWVNDDVAPHTVTSGTGTDDPQSGKLFDSGSLGQGKKFSMPAKHIGAMGEHGYYCIIHPFMKGKITIQ